MSLHEIQQKSIKIPTPRRTLTMISERNKKDVAFPSINPQSAMKAYNQKKFHKLIQINQNYLKDKVKISDVRKPSRYAYRLPSKTGSSQYSRIFARSLPSHDLSNCTPNRSKMANIIKLPDKEITNYQSTYNLQFSRMKQDQLLKKMQMHKAPQYERKQGPFFTETSYNRDYSIRERSPPPTQIKPETHIAIGGKFVDDTTYKQCYQTKDHKDLQKPIFHKDHSIFVKFGKCKQTNYQESYPSAKETPRVQQSCKPIPKLSQIPNKIKYHTEYSDRYVEQALAERKQFQCLSNDELKDYVLNILNKN